MGRSPPPAPRSLRGFMGANASSTEVIASRLVLADYAEPTAPQKAAKTTIELCRSKARASVTPNVRVLARRPRSADGRRRQHPGRCLSFAQLRNLGAEITSLRGPSRQPTGESAPSGFWRLRVRRQHIPTNGHDDV